MGWDDAMISMARPCCRSPGVGGDGMDLWRICDDKLGSCLAGRGVQGYGDTVGCG